MLVVGNTDRTSIKTTMVSSFLSIVFKFGSLREQPKTKLVFLVFLSSDRLMNTHQNTFYWLSSRDWHTRLHYWVVVLLFLMDRKKPYSKPSLSSMKGFFITTIIIIFFFFLSSLFPRLFSWFPSILHRKKQNVTQTHSKILSSQHVLVEYLSVDDFHTNLSQWHIIGMAKKQNSTGDLINLQCMIF